MKYQAAITNAHGKLFLVEALDDYVCTAGDIPSLQRVLEDTAVRAYITDEAMHKWGFSRVDDLAVDILRHSSDRWSQRKELRFLIRSDNRAIAGMVGVNLVADDEGELWYYKAAAFPSFMIEALKVVLPFVKQEGIRSLFANLEPTNKASQRLLSNLGFVTISEMDDQLVMKKDAL